MLDSRAGVDKALHLLLVGVGLLEEPSVEGLEEPWEIGVALVAEAVGGDDHEAGLGGGVGEDGGEDWEEDAGGAGADGRGHELWCEGVLECRTTTWIIG